MACNVCCEEFNTKKHKKIVCNLCKFELCCVCFETYQETNSGLYDVHCMKCKQLWDDNFLHDNIPNSVLKRLRETTKKRLRDEETSFMPETLYYIQYDKAVRTEKVQHYESLSENLGNIQRDLRNHNVTKIFSKGEDKKKQLKDIIKLKYTEELIKNNMKKTFDAISIWNTHLRPSVFFMDIVPDELKEKVRNRNSFQNYTNRSTATESPVVCKCPGDCRGFIVKPAYKCGLCEIKICSTCHVNLSENEEHTCKPEDVETAQFIKRTSKPCPKCAAMIHKIEGCDQMWCTACNTPFSWITGNIIRNSAIHNPHYYEWMNNHNGRLDENVHNVNNCEGLPDYYHVLTHVRIVSKDDRFNRYISKIHRLCTHVRHLCNDNQNGAVNYENTFFTNLRLRMQWMQKEITDKMYDTQLHKKYKKKIVCQKIEQVHQLVVTLASDVFHRLLRDNNADDKASYIREFEEIYKYANTCFEKLHNIYKVVMPMFKEVEFMCY